MYGVSCGDIFTRFFIFRGPHFDVVIDFGKNHFLVNFQLGEIFNKGENTLKNTRTYNISNFTLATTAELNPESATEYIYLENQSYENSIP